MSDLRAAVSLAAGLRELAEYVPVDTRAVCEQCQRRSVDVWSMMQTLAGVTKSWVECGRCLRQRRAA